MNGTNQLKSKFPKMFTFSDVHFFHPTVPIENIIESIETVMPKDEELSLLDIIIIPGDLFDKTTYFEDSDTLLFHNWACQFLRLCKYYDITVWILEGTPRHDRKQSNWLNEINQSAKIYADLHYFDGMGIYYCPKTKKSIGYIKDEYTIDPKDSYNAFREALNEKGIDSVDIMLMHCMWDFQAPVNVPNLKTHDSQLYKLLVNDFILSGHIHTGGIYDNFFLVPGSVTRLRHGEPEKKGALFITYTGEHDISVKFIENTNAMIFTSLKLTEYGDDINTDKLKGIVNQLTYPEGSFIQVVIHEDNTHLAPLSFFNQLRPHYHWTKKIIRKEKDDNRVLDLGNITTVKIDDITPDNLIPLVATRLNDHNIDNNELDSYLSLLEKAISS